MNIAKKIYPFQRETCFQPPKSTAENGEHIYSDQFDFAAAVRRRSGAQQTAHPDPFDRLVHHQREHPGEHVRLSTGRTRSGGYAGQLRTGRHRSAACRSTHRHRLRRQIDRSREDRRTDRFQRDHSGPGAGQCAAQCERPAGRGKHCEHTGQSDDRRRK